MGTFDIYSKRKKRKSGQKPDVYVYDEIPKPLRVQMVHMIRDLIDKAKYTYEGKSTCSEIQRILCREYGVFFLGGENIPIENDIMQFLLNTNDANKVLDVVELTIKLTSDIVFHEDFDILISELNQRFLEHGVGYQFESGEIMRIDSQFVHAKVVKPVLDLLSDPLYAGANGEFLGAHEHYRHGRHEPCIVESLKAFESTMKIICKKRKWAYNETDTAKKLIKACMDNNLIPSSQQTQFASFRSLLESGLPTIRNKQGGHGRGAKVRNVPGGVARYALNLTAANILFLIEAEKELP